MDWKYRSDMDPLIVPEKLVGRKVSLCTSCMLETEEQSISGVFLVEVGIDRIVGNFLTDAPCSVYARGAARREYPEGPHFKLARRVRPVIGEMSLCSPDECADEMSGRIEVLAEELSEFDETLAFEGVLAGKLPDQGVVGLEGSGGDEVGGKRRPPV